MDVELQKRINDAVVALSQMSAQPIDFAQMDPVTKMMLVALVSESQKVQDYADSASERIVERFCTDFIPRQKVGAMPAVCLLRPELKPRSESYPVTVGSGAEFSYKNPKDDGTLNYIPIFNTLMLPNSGMYLLNYRYLKLDNSRIDISMEKRNQAWVGIKTKTEVNNMKGLSMLIKGTGGMMPEHVVMGITGQELDFSSTLEMENIEMAEPFDAQQSSATFFSIIESWKESLLNIADGILLYITDDTTDRDLFKPRQFPKMFQQWLESEVLDCFDSNTIWMRLDFPEGYVVPDDFSVELGVLPVTNIDVCSLMLTQAQPIAKLEGPENSFFLRVLETSTTSHQQGFNMTADEIIIRDFDAVCYNNGNLYRDVRNLYNRFIDDYYAFIEYNGIKDGEVLKQLRETINRLGKSVGQQNEKFKFDSGTYAMKNMNQYPPTSSTRVSFITTMGRIGNSPRVGEKMENKREPALEQEAYVIVSAMGGTDKATADERYEQLRYYSLTNDRLYTRMDIDAFLRKELLAEFGKEEFRRIFVKMSIEGAAGGDKLQRGLYINIEFKDRKNYEHACGMSLSNLLEQRIRNRSCIAMPIIITLKNLEED
jgi:hypothetical protein